MVDVAFHRVVALDPVTETLVADASGQVFAVEDTERANPLPVRDLGGVAFPGGFVPVRDGLTAGFIADSAVLGETLEAVWVSGEHTIPLWSPQGLTGLARDAAIAAAASAVDVSAAVAEVQRVERELLRARTFTANLSGQFTLALGAGCVLQRTIFAGPTRLRLYRTAAGRAADAGRVWSTDYHPSMKCGLLYDFWAVTAETDGESPVNLAGVGGQQIFGVVDRPATVTFVYSITMEDE